MLSPLTSFTDSPHLSEHEEHDDEQTDPPKRINPSLCRRFTESITSDLSAPVPSAILSTETVLLENRNSVIIS